MANHKNKKQKKPGRRIAFTLIELLVVISIIGLLASIVLVAVNNARSSAKLAKVQEDFDQIDKQIELIRDQDNETLGQITGDYWTPGDGGCASYPVISYNLTPHSYQNLSHSDPCYIWLNSQAQKLGFTSVPIDPWGAPYLIDENEGELQYGACNTASSTEDLITSAGPDGYYRTADDLHYWVPFFQCAY